MVKFIKHGQRVECRSYTHDFRYVDQPGAGYGFDCDKDGNLKPDLCEVAKENYAKCLTGEVDGRRVDDVGVMTSRWQYYDPAVIACEQCGTHVELNLGDYCSTCDKCGADYNLSGQRLAPRSQWGEETGETLADILGPRDPNRDDW